MYYCSSTFKPQGLMFSYSTVEYRSRMKSSFFLKNVSTLMLKVEAGQRGLKQKETMQLMVSLRLQMVKKVSMKTLYSNFLIASPNQSSEKPFVVSLVTAIGFIVLLPLETSVFSHPLI